MNVLLLFIDENRGMVENTMMSEKGLSWVTFIDEALLRETLDEIDYENSQETSDADFSFKNQCDETELFQPDVTNDFFIIDNQPLKNTGITIMEDHFLNSKGHKFRLLDYDSGDEFVSESKIPIKEGTQERRHYECTYAEDKEEYTKSEDEKGRLSDHANSEQYTGNNSLLKIENGNIGMLKEILKCDKFNNYYYDIALKKESEMRDKVIQGNEDSSMKGKKCLKMVERNTTMINKLTQQDCKGVRYEV